MKKFITYEEQVQLLKDRKLIITDEEKFILNLKDIGYYNLINGYSFIFKYSFNDMYRNSASDNDIYHLYKFDKSLRNIVYKYALMVESKIKSQISHIFSKYHGIDHRKYLKQSCFDKDKSKEKRIIKLINNCKSTIADSSDKTKNRYRTYIGHYLRKHKQILLWVLSRAMTMGEISLFYSSMQLKEKIEVANYFKVKPAHLEIMLKMLVAYRNIVAHDERIFCVKLNSDQLPYNLPIYDKMKILKGETGAPYVGKKDFLALMIIFKYLLPVLDFSGFWIELEAEQTVLVKNVKQFFVEQIYNMMGLKNKWRALLTCSLIEQ